MRFAHLVVAGLMGLAAVPAANGQGPRPGRGAPRGERGPGGVEAAVERLMAFDKNNDGQLSAEELSDPRLEKLFQRADADRDGSLTKEELIATFTKDAASAPRGRGEPPGNGPGGPGRPDGGRPRGESPTPFGRILPGFAAEQLQLTDAQREAIEKLQRDAEAKLAGILTRQQRDQLEQLGRREPEGFGRPPDGRRRPPPPRGER